MAEKPVTTIRVNGVESAVWRNQRKDGSAVFYSATYKRNFRDGDEWKDTDSYTGVRDNDSLEIAAREVKLFIGQQMELDKEREPQKEKGKGRSRSAA